MPNTNCLEGIRCPQCENDSLFHITCTTLAAVTDDGAETFGDMEWDEYSPISCPECRHRGSVSEFGQRPASPSLLRALDGLLAIFDDEIAQGLLWADRRIEFAREAYAIASLDNGTRLASCRRRATSNQPKGVIPCRKSE
jgi:hypothetical protein